MQAKDIKPKATHTKLRMLDLIERGIIIAISRLTVDQVETDHGWVVQTLAIGATHDTPSAFPVVVIDQHADDCEAMKYAVSIFEALKARGLLSSDQAARYRRALITLVPQTSRTEG
ncbi:hypothetical protein LNN35_22020 [Pseudomonas stutzeri]|jgi:hypothetical protein|uniref:Uncharacterized protein n=3 Tax=Pseudomonadaceae TaxID=135621 RepID=A0A385FW51_PSEAI|nr:MULTISPECIES: hypothetical protein [Pseudomonadaceae]AXV45905.1 hypothetical protein pMKPA34_0061 [Pseudomonas aeruginosa]MBA1306075.1 hypothetical protein [Stutzerimonas stutzeri]MBO8344038.1 hypothetical protein [Pseudomonas aeruginosa]MBS9726627.1 hypothetical protein [Stutzerimonas stutzeri]MCC8345444.1 hypothetical protein [Stutzerimonas stutzeri]